MTRLRGQQVGRWWGAGGGLQKRFKIRKVFLVEFKGDQDGFLVVIVQDLILKRVVEGQDIGQGCELPLVHIRSRDRSCTQRRRLECAPQMLPTDGRTCAATSVTLRVITVWTKGGKRVDLGSGQSIPASAVGRPTTA